MTIKRYEPDSYGEMEETEGGTYCKYLEYYFLHKEYKQLQREHSILLEKMDRRRVLTKSL